LQRHYGQVLAWLHSVGGTPRGHELSRSYLKQQPHLGLALRPRVGNRLDEVRTLNLVPVAHEAAHLEQRAQSRALYVCVVRQARARQIVGRDVAITQVEGATYLPVPIRQLQKLCGGNLSLEGAEVPLGLIEVGLVP
jgi:hypothetical protein